jgi:hypothetical protein
LGKSTALMERWSRTYDWVARVSASEDHAEMLGRQKLEELLEEKAQDRAERLLRLQEKALELREKIADQVEKMVGWPLAEQRVFREGEGDNGEDVVYVFEPARWSKATIAGLYNIVAGDRSDILQEVEPEEFDWSGFSSEELEEYVRLAEKVRPMTRRDGGR